MAQALQRHCGEVSLLGPIKVPAQPLAKAFSKMLWKTVRRRYLYTHSLWFSRQVASVVNQRLASEEFDFVFAPAGSTAVAHLDSKLPIVYLSDTTVRLICTYYPEFSNVLPFSLREAELIERTAIGKAAIAIYPSHWAAESAVRDYDASKAKVHTICFGANLDNPPERDVVLGRSSTKECRLLFLGADWERKGGDIAFGTLLALERLDVPASLTIVGCRPPKSVHRKNVTVTGFLDKNKPLERASLFRILLESDFLILPTRMECTAIAFCEASAFGLPILATDTGGVSGAVTNGINGYLLPPDATAQAYAKIIANTFTNRQNYLDLRARSRQMFEEQLNWDSWARTVKETVATII